jgi:tripartite-type tricarboxylate transporter receptor subunit TctC
MAGFRALAASALAYVTASVAPALAATDVTEFYTGKTLTFIIGTENSSYARTIGRHLVKYIPGNPSISFQNMTGQRSRKAAAALYQLAPGDGLTIGAILPNAVMAPLVEEIDKKKKFDPLKFHYLGSASSSVLVCMVDSEAPAATFEQALKYPLIMGARKSGGTTRDSVMMLKNLLGASFRLVDGYRDRAQILEALMHGEIHGLCGYSWSALKRQRFDLIADKKVNLLLQFGLDGNKELTKRGVPTIWEFVSNPKDRAALSLLASSMVFSRPFVAPPGTPRAQVNALRVAFERTMRDVDFRSDAHKNQLNITPTTGEAVQRLIEKVYKTPSDIVERAKQARRG